MAAFEAANYANISDIDGREIKVRPLWDAGLGRTVVELVADGTAVRLSNAAVTHFTNQVLIAAFLGETANVAQGVPTPVDA
jgi:hypothetical protein